MGGRKERRASLALQTLQSRCHSGPPRSFKPFAALTYGYSAHSHRIVRGSHRIVYVSSNGPSVLRVEALAGGLRGCLQRLTTTRALLTLPLPSIARKEIVCSPEPSKGTSSA